MTEKYTIGFINKKLKQYDAKLVRNREGSYLEHESKKTPILITTSGKIDEDSVNKIAKILSKEKNKKQTDIYSYLTRKKDFYSPRISFSLERILDYTIILFLGCLTFFIFTKINLFTGFVISNISNTTINMLIFVCAFGVIGLLYYKLRYKSVK